MHAIGGESEGRRNDGKDGKGRGEREGMVDRGSGEWAAAKAAEGWA